DAEEQKTPRQVCGRGRGVAFPHQRPPRDWGGNRRKNRVARRTSLERLQELEKYRLATPIVNGFQHRFGARIVRLVGTGQKQFTGFGIDLYRAQIEGFVTRVGKSSMGKKIDKLAGAY